MEWLEDAMDAGLYVLYLDIPSTAGDDDCACPADGLDWDEPTAPAGGLYQAAPLHLEPLDTDFAVGYSPFVAAGRPS